MLARTVKAEGLSYPAVDFRGSTYVVLVGHEDDAVAKGKAEAVLQKALDAATTELLRNGYVIQQQPWASRTK